MTTTRRTRTTTKVASAAAGLGLAAVAVLGASNAAFLAKSDPNADNNWATAADPGDDGVPGTPDDPDPLVKLDFGERATAPLFSFGLGGAAAPVDGSTQLPHDGYLGETEVDNALDTDGKRDITVEYEGVTDADVRMYVDDGYTDPKNLDEKTNVTVYIDDVAAWTGKLSEMPTTWGDAEDTGWDAVSAEADTPDTAKYTVEITKDADAPESATIQDVDFIWEAQH